MLRASLVLLILFPGCLSPPPPSTSPTTAPDVPGSTTLPFGLADCEFLVAIVIAPASRVQERMPAGFSPVPIAGDDVGGGQVRLGFELDRCKSAVGVEGTIPDAPYAAMWTRATPPSDLALGDKPIFVAWEWIDPDPVRSEIMKTDGFPAQGGTVRFTGLSPDGQIDRTGEASWSTGATWRLEAEGLPPPATATGGSLAQYVEGENGTLSRWSWNWSTTSWFQQWTGTLRLESHWASTLFDSPVVSATFLRGRWSYTDGTIEYPIVRAG